MTTEAQLAGVEATGRDRREPRGDEVTLRRTDALNLRRVLEPHFRHDTSVDRAQYRGGSDGHCAAVATIVHTMFGGTLVSTKSERISHWYNRLAFEDGVFDVDLTGDQFGHLAFRFAPAGSLYPDGVERSTSEVNEDTRDRARRLARRAGISLAGLDGLDGLLEAVVEAARAVRGAALPEVVATTGIHIYPAEDLPGMWLAYIHDLDIVTQGTSPEHAASMAVEASELIIADDIAEGRDPECRRQSSPSATFRTALRRLESALDSLDARYERQQRERQQR